MNTLQSVDFDTSIVVYVFRIQTWTHVSLTLICACVLLTGEPGRIRNTIAPRNFMMQAPSAQCLEDTAPTGEARKRHPLVPWDVLREGAHIYAFRPISSLLIWGAKSPEILYNIAIRSMFFASTTTS